MEMFSKKNGARFFPPETDFQVQNGMRGGTNFFEGELVDLPAHPVFRRNGISCRYDTFKHLSKRQIAHQIVSNHVSGGADPFIM